MSDLSDKKEKTLIVPFWNRLFVSFIDQKWFTGACFSAAEFLLLNVVWKKKITTKKKNNKKNTNTIVLGRILSKNF